MKVHKAYVSLTIKKLLLSVVSTIDCFSHKDRNGFACIDHVQPNK